MSNNRASGIVKYTATSGKHKWWRNATYEWLKKQDGPKTGEEIIEAYTNGEILARTGMPFSTKYVPRRPNDVSQRLRRDARFKSVKVWSRRPHGGGSYYIHSWTVVE